MKAGAERLLLAASLSSSRQGKQCSVVLAAVGRKRIGELAGKFSDAYVQKTKPQMDWRAIKNMRNMFAHDYGSMDKDRIWQTATEDVPALKAYCERALTEDF